MEDSSKYSLVSNDVLQDQRYAVQHQPTAYAAPTQPPVYSNQAPVSSNIHQFPHQATVTQTYGNFNVNPVTSQPIVMNTTTVITTQPKRHWRTGLGDCCKDCSVCMCAWCFGYCYSCALAQKMGESGCVMCCPGGLSALRTQYRSTHRIEGTLMDDLCKSCCCHSCVLCQMGNDMKAEEYPKICCC